jgi:hypothetical protein
VFSGGTGTSAVLGDGWTDFGVAASLCLKLQQANPDDHLHPPRACATKSKWIERRIDSSQTHRRLLLCTLWRRSSFARLWCRRPLHVRRRTLWRKHRAAFALIALHVLRRVSRRDVARRVPGRLIGHLCRRLDLDVGHVGRVRLERSRTIRPDCHSSPHTLCARQPAIPNNSATYPSPLLLLNQSPHRAA